MRAPGSVCSRLRDRACRTTSRAALDPLRRAEWPDLFRTAMRRRPATESSNTRRGPVPGQQWYSSVQPNPTPCERPITCPDAPGSPARDHCGGRVSGKSCERSGNSRRRGFAAADHRSSLDRTVDVRDHENLGPRRRRLLASGGRSVHRSGRQERCAREPTGGRRLDTGWALSDRPDDVRQLAESGRCVSLRSPPLRGLVGRGLEVSGLQHVPARRLRTTSAVQGDDAGHVDIAARLRTSGGGRVQHASRRSRTRLGHLPACADRKGDERLHQPAAAGPPPRAPLARSGLETRDLDRSRFVSCFLRKSMLT